MRARVEVVVLMMVASLALAAAPPHAGAVATGPVRARDLGVPFELGRPGRWNAITDVSGVAVGHVTLVEGESVRTGVTAILPRGRGEDATRPCFGAVFALNGNGEMTGTAWVRDSRTRGISRWYNSSSWMLSVWSDQR